MATELVSYDLHGVKESFANWISNISPTDTPFTSMTGKEAITNKYFQWQTDKLGHVADGSTNNPLNAHEEGSVAGDGNLEATVVKQNVTQILRKVVKVSDTADALSSYGRGQELAYQMEKAGAEIKRDLEWTLLNQKTGADITAPGVPSTSTPANVRKTKGFQALVAPVGTNAPEGVPVTIEYTKPTTAGAPAFTEEVLFNLTENLYTVGAQPSVIMFHPSHAKIFSGLMEKGGVRQRMFDGAADTKINTYVSTLVDPLGQEFKLIPNRFMPVDAIYCFDPSDWTQMVLRAPQRTKLAKDGSYEKWMIEMEVGLRHRNDFASGVLILK